MLDPFANAVELVIVLKPPEPITDEAKNRIVPIRFDAEDHHAR
jgi:hypothetical protein